MIGRLSDFSHLKEGHCLEEAKEWIETSLPTLTEYGGDLDNLEQVKGFMKTCTHMLYETIRALLWDENLYDFCPEELIERIKNAVLVYAKLDPEINYRYRKTLDYVYNCSKDNTIFDQLIQKYNWND